MHRRTSTNAIQHHNRHMDEYLKMFERMGRECTYLFYEYVVEFYGDIYLRKPARSDVEQLYVAHSTKHDFL